MAESPVQLKDGGISDILSESDRKPTEAESPKITEITGSRENDTETNQIEPEAAKGNKGIVSSGQHEVSNGNAETVSISSRNGKTSPSSFTGELDLADPNSVIQMLENVDLTEEDTEDLLQEAYNMNRKLKEMLRRQEMESSSSKPKMKSRGNKANAESRLFNNGQGSLSSTASSSGNNSRNGSSFGIRKVLPPISQGDNDTSVYAIKLRRSKTQVPDMKTLGETSVLRTRSTTKPTRKEAESPTRRRKASGPKPQWNDRFNYS